MPVKLLQHVAERCGYSIHRKSSLDVLRSEIKQLKARAERQDALIQTSLINEPPEDMTLGEECAWLRRELRKHEDKEIFYKTTEDYNSFEKMKHIVDRIVDFGNTDFAELSCWIFAASLNNHRVVHQRIDEGSMLWRAVKMSNGPILEVGRAAGGSTLILLGASGDRPVISVDRAPQHANIAQHVFDRDDVAKRLTLHRQTSREPIPETEFGIVFIDADHSYEGVCHDIGTFWNQLKSYDGKPPLAAFHDAADNPITYVEPVKTACEELLAEPGAARIVESWGSMLVLEKTGDIDADKWFAKTHKAYWQQYSGSEQDILEPADLVGSLVAEKPSQQTDLVNLLGEENIDDETWTKCGLSVDTANLNADNPLRHLHETPELGEHSAAKKIQLGVAKFKYSVFLRPDNNPFIRLSVQYPDQSPLAHIDFELAVHSRIAGTFAADGVKLLDAEFNYRNGYFWCSVSVELPSVLDSAIFSINTLNKAGGSSKFKGREEAGLFVNLSSVREIL